MEEEEVNKVWAVQKDNQVVAFFRSYGGALKAARRLTKIPKEWTKVGPNTWRLGSLTITVRFHRLFD